MSAVDVLLVVAIAWAALAFGAVYPWAYWPLAAAAAAVAILSLTIGPRRLSLGLGPLIATLGLFALAVGVQVISISPEWLQHVSPRALDVVIAFDLTVASRHGRHALSISPARTTTGLILFVAFSLLVIGTARLFTIRGPRSFAQALTVIGVLLALIGIVQKPFFTGRIYGFWTPNNGANPFGPFVNKNHFAGWMMMALPITLGMLSSGIARGMRQVQPTLRERILWLSSGDGSRLLLLAGAAAVMALSLVLTMSRSGMAAMLFALALTGLIAVRRQRSAARRTIVASYLVLLIVALVGLVGVDTIANRFAEGSWGEFNSRRGAWADALSIASIFPIAGTGLNTYAVAILFFQQHDLELYYRAAHNDYLQLMAEGGVLLVVPAILCLAAFGVAVRQRFKEESGSSRYWLRVGAVTGLAAIALQETVDFSLQIPANAALFAVLCGLALHRSPRPAISVIHPAS